MGQDNVAGTADPQAPPADVECHICGVVLQTTMLGLVCPNYTSHPVKQEKEEVE